MTLHAALDRYLALRRSLGYSLRSDELVLRRFLSFAVSEGASHISTDLFLRWQGSFGKTNLRPWSGRYTIVRIFAEWLHGHDPQHEVPPRGLLPKRANRPRPYIYNDDEIASIIREASRLPSIYGMRGLTYSTFFGLIATTGLRISEATGLDVRDVNLLDGILNVRLGKFGKTRLLPLDPGVAERLRNYARERDRLLGGTPSPFFVQCSGTRVTTDTAREVFAQISQHIGLRQKKYGSPIGQGPRIHDLRHSFAVRTMIGWYKTGKSPTHEMIKLSTWLGHSNPTHTYWYIEAVPELLALASRRADSALDREVLQ